MPNFSAATNFGGHGSTRYAEWLEQKPDQLLPIECVHSNRYEPYLVVRYCSQLPPFQKIFSGYGKNKVRSILFCRPQVKNDSIFVRFISTCQSP